MFSKFVKFFLYFVFGLLFLTNVSFSEIINSIEIKGNDRVSKDTIVMFSDVTEGDTINSEKIDNILKNIYDSNFFDNVSIKFENNKLIINVKELPIIQNILYEGVKANRIKDKIFKNLDLKPRSSYNELLLKRQN